MELDKTFRPTEQWMAEKYTELNNWLFDGELGPCDFVVFTTGNGSQGRRLGSFMLKTENIFVNSATRRMYFGDKYINRDNFAEICKPKIGINGNYSGTEDVFLGVLVHEMCHYYTYMDGYCPSKPHGTEFMAIGREAAMASNGKFSIQRIATAEEMSGLNLNSQIKARNEKKLANKKSAVSAIIVFARDGDVRLTITSSKSVMDEVYEYERNEKIITTKDPNVIEYLFNKGCRKNMRTYKFWRIGDKPWFNEFKNMLK